MRVVEHWCCYSSLFCTCFEHAFDVGVHGKDSSAEDSMGCPRNASFQGCSFPEAWPKTSIIGIDYFIQQVWIVVDFLNSCLQFWQPDDHHFRQMGLAQISVFNTVSVLPSHGVLLSATSDLRLPPGGLTTVHVVTVHARPKSVHIGSDHYQRSEAWYRFSFAVAVGNYLTWSGFYCRFCFQGNKTGCRCSLTMGV